MTERSFQKDLQDIVEAKSPRAWTFGAKSFNSAGNKKTFRNGHYSGKKRDNFKLRTKIVPRELRPKYSGVTESLPHPRLVIHPWRIYSSYGHWDDHFDDGYIRHMALNGLNWCYVSVFFSNCSSFNTSGFNPFACTPQCVEKVHFWRICFCTGRNLFVMQNFNQQQIWEWFTHFPTRSRLSTFDHIVGKS